jgi:hypothetical protein
LSFPSLFTILESWTVLIIQTGLLYFQTWTIMSPFLQNNDDYVLQSFASFPRLYAMPMLVLMVSETCHFCLTCFSYIILRIIDAVLMWLLLPNIGTKSIVFFRFFPLVTHIPMLKCTNIASHAILMSIPYFIRF